jgi:hypothetical protein
MDSEPKKLTVLDYVDNIRAQFDKISKLAASLEDWERQGSDAKMEEHHIQSARGVISAGLQMRESLYKVERVAFNVTEKHGARMDARLSSFFYEE